jgi:hypothetical protein
VIKPIPAPEDGLGLPSWGLRLCVREQRYWAARKPQAGGRGGTVFPLVPPAPWISLSRPANRASALSMPTSVWQRAFCAHQRLPQHAGAPAQFDIRCKMGHSASARRRGRARRARTSREKNRCSPPPACSSLPPLPSVLSLLAGPLGRCHAIVGPHRGAALRPFFRRGYPRRNRAPRHWLGRLGSHPPLALMRTSGHAGHRLAMAFCGIDSIGSDAQQPTWWRPLSPARVGGPPVACRENKSSGLQTDAGADIGRVVPTLLPLTERTVARRGSGAALIGAVPRFPRLGATRRTS